MKTVLVTGSNGFIGKNLCAQLKNEKDLVILGFDSDNTKKELEKYIKKADFIFHLAGVNRPTDEKDFDIGNRGLTEDILGLLDKHNKKTPILITSSIQAELDNSYGKSKKAAENAIFKFYKGIKNKAFVYRLPNVFGKWSRPNYNSAVATFCYNISHDLPVKIDNPSAEINLVYIDEIISEFIKALNKKIKVNKDGYCYIPRSFKTTVGELKDNIESYKLNRDNLIVPNFDDDFNRFLYATYTSFLADDNFGYQLKTNFDERGWLAEFVKSKQFGQIFISKTKPGITRGNHWHHTKIEKFLVVEGAAEVCFRNIQSKNVLKYRVSGDQLSVVDIPAGYTHSIKNIGDKDLITIFWADELFNKENPDTYYENVDLEEVK